MNALTKAIEEMAHFLMVLLLGIVVGVGAAGAFYYKTAYRYETQTAIYMVHGMVLDKKHPEKSHVVDVRIPWWTGKDIR